MADSKIPEKVPLRKLDIFQTDDGRRIEVFTKTGLIKHIHRQNQDDPESNEVPQFDPSEKIFVGVAQIGTMFGLKEIKFEIPAKDIDDAFTQYYEYAEAAAEELHRKILEARAQKEQENKIVTASADDLNMINQAAHLNDDEEGIILP